MKAVEICDYANSPWRTEFWRGRDYEDRAERIALARLLPPRGTRVCEIGAGFGRLADFYLGYDQIILIDYARSMLLEAREHIIHDSRFTHPSTPLRSAQDAPRFYFVAADLYNLPLADNALDTALTIRVLHHVTDVPRAFGEIARAVRPNGTYVLEHANKRNLKAIARYALRRGPNPFTREPYEFVKLNFDLHPRYVIENLRAVNFSARAKRAVSTFRIPLLKKFVPTAILAALDGMFQSPISNLAISPSIFIRAESRKPGLPTLNPALWRCVACHSTDIAESNDALACRACARIYPIVDGIIEFK
ncbi:MAG: class I SAM-dependent methyltransferase [Chloroflexi bacterium]|nr:class I SAM-dependent methyltransferase [Chloroflexota bacterium]